MILLDTSGLLAWLDGSQRRHAEVAAAMERVEPPYILSPFVLAELDYLLWKRVGAAAAKAILREVARGSYRLVPFSAADVDLALMTIERYADLELGIADASLVVLADRHRTRDVLTLDERHFRVVRTAGGKSLRLFPADA